MQLSGEVAVLVIAEFAFVRRLPLVVFQQGIDFGVPKAFFGVGVFAFPLGPVEVVAADDTVQTGGEAADEAMRLVGVAEAFGVFCFIESFLQGVAEELGAVFLLCLHGKHHAKCCYDDDSFFHDASYLRMSFWMLVPMDVSALIR